jgi:hypothetical protein
MRDLINLLLNQPILLIILIGWIVSMLGGVMRRAVERQQREQRQQQRKPKPEQKSAEEIAAELRRMMGMEARTEVREPPAQRPPAQRPVPPQPLPQALDDVEAARDARRQRREQELAEAEALRRARLEAAARAEGRPLPKPQPAKAPSISVAPHTLSTAEHTLGKIKAEPRTPARQRSRLEIAPPLSGRRIDLRDPARAIILTEVLGPPLALRPPADGTPGL